MKHIVLALSFTAMTLSATDASVSNTRFLGESNDPHLVCGLDIEVDKDATVLPFIEATTAILGTYRLEVSKVSSGGASRSIQANAFAGTALGNAKMRVDWPAELTVTLSVESADGTQLCATHVQFGPQSSNALE